MLNFLIIVYTSLKIRVDSKCVSLTSSKNPRASAQLCIRIYYVASSIYVWFCTDCSLQPILVDVHELTKNVWEMFYYY